MNITEVIIHQLCNIFLLTNEEKSILQAGEVMREAQKRTLEAISAFNNKYYDGKINPLNGVMYCNFLYQLSRCTYASNNIDITEKIYCLNKMLHAVELFYEVPLPAHWSCEHPIGSVIGRAEYGDYFFFYQGCTVGSSYCEGTFLYPVIGENVTMYSHSKILGSSHIGNNVVLSANSYVINEDVPDNCIVFGQSPHLVIKKIKDGKRYNHLKRGGGNAK